MTTLVECWNKLDGNVGELSSWVTTKVSNHLALAVFVEYSLMPFMNFFIVTTSLTFPGLCCS